jgi:gliding motility-associated-like protein
MKKFAVFLILMPVFSNTYSLNSLSNYFIKNQGQISSFETKESLNYVLYYVSTTNAKFYITKYGFTYLFLKNEYEADSTEYPTIKLTHWQRVDVNLKNANFSTVEERNPTPWHYNFYYAHCPNGIKDVPAFSELYFKNVYNGIDLKLYFENNNLKYDFIVKPFADYKQIQIEYLYTDNPSYNEGDIIFTTPLGQIKETKPICFQEGKLIYKSNWEVHNKTLTLNISEYDKSKTLIIDPFLIWSTYFGGNGDEVAEGVYYSNNLLIVAGNTTSNNLPTINPGNGAYFNGNITGLTDLFIAAFDNNDNLIWLTYYGGTLNDQKARPLITNNYIYIWGQTNSTDIPTYNPGGGAFYQGFLNNTGTYDGFLIKFDLNSNLLWATYLGGSDQDEISSLANTNNYLYAYVFTYSNDLPLVDPGNGAWQQSVSNNNPHVYLAQFNINTNALRWATYFGQSVTSMGHSWNQITCSNDHLYTVFNTADNNAPVLNFPGAYFDDTYNGGPSDLIISKFNENGVLVWSTYFGGNGYEENRGICIANNKLWIGATTSSIANMPLVNPGNGAYFQNTYGGGAYDGFIASFNLDGQLLWSTYYGGSSAEYIRDIKGDNYGIFITGRVFNSGFPTYNPGTPTFFQPNVKQTFIAKFKQNGIRQWATYFSGSNADARKLSVTNTAVYLVGMINNTLDLVDEGNGAFFDNTFNGGSTDAFIAKFDKCVIPQVSITTNNSAICLHDSTWLYGNGGISYIWSTLETTDSILVKPLSSSSYSVTVTDDMACTNVASTYITVYPLPDVNITGAHSICYGDSITLNANGANTYQWLPLLETTEEITVQPSVTTTYYLIGTDVNGCQNIDSVEIVVNPLPDVSILGAHPICFKDSVWLYGSGASQYTWSQGSLIADSIYISPQTSTIYYVTGTDSNGCKNIDSAEVIVYPLPDVQILGAHPICFGDSITLFASGANSYLWTPGSSTTDSIIVSPLSTTNYYLLGVDTNMCKNIDTVTVVVYQLPNVQISGDHPICFGDSITLTATGALTYLWLPDSLTGNSQTYYPTVNSTYVVVGTDFNQCKNSDTVTVIVHPLPDVKIIGNHPICFGDNLTLTAINANTYIWSTSETTSSIIVSPQQTTLYTVTGTDINGCKNSDTTLVIVNPLPIVSINGVNPICLNDSITLTASGATNYSWQPWNYNTSQITVSPPTSTNIILTGVDDNGCVNTDTATLIVYPLPEISVTGVQPICFGDSISLTAHGAVNYIWQPGNLTGSSVTISPQVTQTYYVYATDHNNCKDTTSFSITVYELPVASISGINQICQQETVTLTASGGHSYLWSTGETSSTIEVSPMNTTTYSLIAKMNICYDTAYFTIVVDPKPQLTITADTTIIIGMSVPLKVNGANSYIWSPITYLSCYTCSNPVSKPSETIEYCVEGINNYGCRDTACVIVTVDKECGEVFIPSGFSPNNDGNNDVLYVRGKCIKKMQFIIFNRWGEKVFESSDPDIGWDGTFRGKPMESGVFVYYLTAEYYNGLIVKKQGNVTLIR